MSIISLQPPHKRLNSSNAEACIENIAVSDEASQVSTVVNPVFSGSASTGRQTLTHLESAVSLATSRDTASGANVSLDSSISLNGTVITLIDPDVVAQLDNLLASNCRPRRNPGMKRPRSSTIPIFERLPVPRAAPQFKGLYEKFESTFLSGMNSNSFPWEKLFFPGMKVYYYADRTKHEVIYERAEVESGKIYVWVKKGNLTAKIRIFHCKPRLEPGDFCFLFDTSCKMNSIALKKFSLTQFLGEESGLEIFENWGINPLKQNGKGWVLQAGCSQSFGSQLLGCIPVPKAFNDFSKPDMAVVEEMIAVLGDSGLKDFCNDGSAYFLSEEELLHYKNLFQSSQQSSRAPSSSAISMASHSRTTPLPLHSPSSSAISMASCLDLVARAKGTFISASSLNRSSQLQCAGPSLPSLTGANKPFLIAFPSGSGSPQSENESSSLTPLNMANGSSPDASP